jgi:predicted component of type VI protein secretion system
LAKLELVEGKGRGTAVPLAGKSIFEVGSARTADVPLEDTEVAPVHVKVYAANGEFCAFDVSGRGFLHNGNRTLKTQLANGDMITLGKSRLCFLTDDAATAASTPSPGGASSRVELQAVKGNDAGKKFDLAAKDMFIIGRGVATDITVWDIRVSRVHCRIDRDKDGYLITDLNASNGTYVNGQKIDTHRLKAGDEIKLGSTILQYIQA